jgi:hypothetical protein
VFFHLLQHKDAINTTQRHIAAATHVALGSIPQVMDGLVQSGYLIAKNKKQLVWLNKENALQRWIMEYGTVLRPKLSKGRFSFDGDWNQLPLDHTQTQWGGERAAEILTQYLRPEKAVLYTRESRVDLMKRYRLKPDADGEIEVLDMFWQPEEAPVVPHLLIYADLLLEGGKRNHEIADRIYAEHIKPNL